MTFLDDKIFLYGDKCLTLSAISIAKPIDNCDKMRHMQVYKNKVLMKVYILKMWESNVLGHLV